MEKGFFFVEELNQIIEIENLISECSDNCMLKFSKLTNVMNDNWFMMIILFCPKKSKKFPTSSLFRPLAHPYYTTYDNHLMDIHFLKKN